MNAEAQRQQEREGQGTAARGSRAGPGTTGEELTKGLEEKNRHRASVLALKRFIPNSSEGCAHKKLRCTDMLTELQFFFLLLMFQDVEKGFLN